MKKLVKTGVVLLLVVMGLVLGTCSDGAEELSSDATLGSVTVAGKTVTLGVPSMDWVEAKENAGKVFLSDAQMTNAEVIAAKGQSGQTIFLAAAKPSVMPDFVTGTAFNFEASDFLWVEVFSENHDAYNLYAIEVKKTTPTVLDLTLGGRSATGGQNLKGEPIKQYGKGLGTHNINFASVTEGEIWFGKDQIDTDLAVTVTPEDPDSKVFVAKGTATDTVDALFPADYVNPAPLEFTATDGDYLYLKAASADTDNGETIYYKVKLVAKEVGFGIGGVTMTAQGGIPVEFGVGTAGSQGFGGGENRGNAANLAADGSGYKNIVQTAGPLPVTVGIGTKPAGATFRYGRTDWDSAQENVPSTDHVTLIYQDDAAIPDVETNDYIAVEVTNGLGDKRWYSFRVRLGNPAAELGSVTVAGQSVSTGGMTAGTVIPGNYPYADKKGNVFTAVDPSFTGTSGEVTLSGSQALNVTVSAVSSSTGAAVRYGYLKDQKVPLDSFGFTPGIDYSDASRVIELDTTGLIPTVVETPLNDDVETVIGIGGYIIIEISPQDKGPPLFYVIVATVN